MGVVVGLPGLIVQRRRFPVTRVVFSGMQGEMVARAWAIAEDRNGDDEGFDETTGSTSAASRTTAIGARSIIRTGDCAVEVKAGKPVCPDCYAGWQRR